MKNIFPKVGELEEKTKALIIGGEKFIQPFFEKALSFYGCQVFFQKEISLKKEELINFNYLFFFYPQPEKIQDFLNFVSDKTKILFVLKPGLQNFLEKKIFSIAKEKNLNVRLVYFDEVYGPGMEVEDYRHLLKILEKSNCHPLFISDFIYGLLKAMFGAGTEGGVFFLSKEDKQLGWQPKVDLQEGLRQTEEWLRKTFPQEKEKKKISFSFGIKINYFLTVFLAFLLISLIYPFASIGFFGFFGAKSLKQAQSAILSGDFALAKRRVFLAEKFFEKGDQEINQIANFFSFLNEEKIYKFSKFFILGRNTSRGVSAFLQAADKAQKLFNLTFQKQNGGAEFLIAQIRIDLEKSFNELSLAESQFFGDEKEKISQLRNLIIQTRKGVEILPELLGLKKKQTYLILFQNNNEIRPTGGFIGSYGILTFEEGKLIDFEVKDVYSADGQLKGHVEPPADLKKYLGEAGWYLRDSNWDPDFPSSALRAAWFLEKETGRVVDGVIGINLFLAQRILKAVGEIEVPDFQEKINAENFFERAEYYSEINFFPGSTQKQDFLGSVARVLVEKIKQENEKIWFNLIKNIYPTLKSKDLLLWVKNEEVFNFIKDLGWGGEIRDAKCQTSNVKCLEDYLMVVETNVGINKANYFVKRSFSHQVKIEKDTIEEILHLDYQNNSSSEAFPAGRYRSYIRLYTPQNSELVKIIIKNPQTGLSEELGNEKYEIKEEHGKKVFGFLLEVPIQENRSVEVIYRLGEKLASEIEKYQLFLQKQPGIEDQSFSFWFIPPLGINVLSKKMNFSYSSEGIIFNLQFNQDLLFEISLVK